MTLAKDVHLCDNDCVLLVVGSRVRAVVWTYLCALERSYFFALVFVVVVWCGLLGRHRPVYKDGLVLNQM